MAVNPHRLTQEPVEVLEQATDPNRRMTQLVVEVLYQQLLWRLTQEPVEVLQQVTGASLMRRLTQVVVEVLISQPVHPFGEYPMPEHPDWSPAYIAPAIENPAGAEASYWPMHSREMILGERAPRIRILRR